MSVIHLKAIFSSKLFNFVLEESNRSILKSKQVGNNIDPERKKMGNNYDPEVGNNFDPRSGNNIDPKLRKLGNNFGPRQIWVSCSSAGYT